ncbi:MAG: isocitrate lyase/PEP mutase family protein [Clostridia bacterium]|nr:isocitrate lyase/PEP mutase family protein [Clostridia bacterium]
MKEKLTFRQIMEKNDITICPEIYDCLSAKAVELCNFELVMISSAEFATALQGNPDLGFLTLDDYVHACYYISRATKLPLLVDADDCFGGPLRVFNACKRMAEAGAQGILIVDQDLDNGGILPIKKAVEKFKAAKAAMEGTDCLLIARCDVDPLTDLDEAIERCNRYHEAGADLTLIVKLNAVKDREQRAKILDRIGKEVQGWKMYPDLGATDGKPDVDVDEIARYGFKLVGIHYLMYAAFEGMLDYGHHIYQDRSNVYFNKYNDTGVEFNAAAQFFGVEDGYWESVEAKFVDDPAERKSVWMRHFVMETLKGNK